MYIYRPFRYRNPSSQLLFNISGAPNYSRLEGDNDLLCEICHIMAKDLKNLVGANTTEVNCNVI